uniref:Uncharacterized protein n=1 Tax=Ovis aries TaxID=9940 RepID=A0AC11D9D2_SHEEP
MSGPNGDLGTPVEAGAEGEEDGFGEAEYAAINSMLDQINSCLDHLEEKNDHLHARLQELLESNRQTRLEFQQQLGETPSDASPHLPAYPLGARCGPVAHPPCLPVQLLDAPHSAQALSVYIKRVSNTTALPLSSVSWDEDPSGCQR